jgi:hypothetical protein
VQGSLCLHKGVLYVGRQAKTARIQAYDLDGHEVLGGFSFRDTRLGRSEAGGISVDDERRLWIADTPISRVRTFTVFGREIGGFGHPLDLELEDRSELDLPGRIALPVDVVARGDADGLLLTVASRGERRHAVQLYDGTGRLLRSLRSGGSLRSRFRGIRGIAQRDRLLYVAEAGAGRIQVFRDADFHFQFSHSTPRGPFEPRAVAPLADGRMVVCCGGPASALCVFHPSGHLLRVLATQGTELGCVLEPNDVVVEEGRSDRRSRVAVIDRDGDRVQVFSLEGRCYGAFEERAG